MKFAKIDSLFGEHKEVLTIQEIAAKLRCSDKYIISLIKQDMLPCFIVGRHYRVLREDLFRYFYESSPEYVDLPELIHCSLYGKM